MPRSSHRSAASVRCTVTQKAFTVGTGMLREGWRMPRPQLQAKPRPAHQSPGDGAAGGQALQKVAQSQGSSRSYLRLSSSRWSSRPSPGSAPPRCPLCHGAPPRQHRWGHFPDKGEQISPWVPLQPPSPQPSVTEAPPPLPEGPIPPHTAWPSCSHTKPFPARSWRQTPDSPTLSRHEHG